MVELYGTMHSVLLQWMEGHSEKVISCVNTFDFSRSETSIPN